MKVSLAARWFFEALCRGDTHIKLQRLRVGLHKISAYYTDKDWVSLSRLLDRQHIKAVTIEDLLAVVRPGMEHHWRGDHWNHTPILSDVRTSLISASESPV
jgi:hypothetical protein